MYLHLTGYASAGSETPYEQLFRSDNNGASWRRIGYAWGPYQRTTTLVLSYDGHTAVMHEVVTRHSTLPWNTTDDEHGATVVGPQELLGR